MIDLLMKSFGLILVLLLKKVSMKILKKKIHCLEIALFKNSNSSKLITLDEYIEILWVRNKMIFIL